MALVTTTVEIEGSNLGLFLKPIVEEPTLQALGWNIIYGQRDGYMTFHTEKDKITKLQDACTYPSPSGGVTMSRKILSPVPLTAYDTQCAAVFDNTILAEAKKSGTFTGDLNGTAVMELLMHIYQPVVARDLLRIALLADTALSGDANYSMIDGWYTKLKAQITGSQAIGAISNTAINSTNILATLELAYAAQTRRLRTTPVNEKAFYVTYTVFNAYQNKLIANETLESSRAGLISGQIPTTYKGIQLIPLDIVDQYLIDVDSTSGVVDTPNRIVLAKKDQTGIMIDSPGAGKEMTTWYDINTDLNKFLARYRMDIQIGYEDFFVIGGF